MKKSFVLFVMLCVFLCTFSLTGCIYIRVGENGVTGNGKIETRDVSLDGDLKGVRDQGSFEVVIDPALKGKAVMEGESNILDLMQVRQDSSGVLNIGFQPNTSVWNTQKITVHIPVVNGGLIETSGSGNITLQGADPLKGDAFKLHINGSGNINVNLETRELTANINGSGDILVKGSTENEKININGSGDFNAFDCRAQNADVTIQGSGEISLFVQTRLTGGIFGSGSVTYAGDPPQVTVDVHGSGDVHKR